jgi:hypothetical protein
MLLSKSVEIRQSETASRPAIRRSRICIFYTASVESGLPSPSTEAVIRHRSLNVANGMVSGP